MVDRGINPDLSIWNNKVATKLYMVVTTWHTACKNLPKPEEFLGMLEIQKLLQLVHIFSAVFVENTQAKKMFFITYLSEDSRNVKIQIAILCMSPWI